MYRLANIYYYGHGIEVDIEKALFYYNMAVEKGNDEAIFRLADIYIQGSKIK